MILVALVAVAPPEKPEPVGKAQVYLVPAGTIPLVPFTGLTVNNMPPQTVVVISVITAIGLTVTVTVKVGPLPQAAVLGVTI